MWCFNTSNGVSERFKCKDLAPHCLYTQPRNKAVTQNPKHKWRVRMINDVLQVRDVATSFLATRYSYVSFRIARRAEASKSMGRKGFSLELATDDISVLIYENNYPLRTNITWCSAGKLAVFPSKVKQSPLHAMEALGGRGGIAPTHSRPRH
jgi:hypothetical protein